MPACLQNQNPFASFRDVWQSLPRCARVLLVWVLLEAVFIVIYAITVLVTGTQQQFIFPLLVSRRSAVTLLFTMTPACYSCFLLQNVADQCVLPRQDCGW